MEAKTITIVPVTENGSVFFKGLGTTFKVLSQSLHGSAAVVEHTLEPKCLGAPMHRHSHEDEISYVLEGKLSVIQNGQVKTAGPGEYIAKPRNIFHTFWNAGDERVRFIEMIIPGNFQNYFAEIAPFFPPGQQPMFDKLAETREKYGLEFDMEAAGEIVEKYGLRT
ncbi:MAG TPA: cupin domain-containing protein [Ferruginibacter sp.]|nr:cupin domain-containing protein [Ferruginibacter sp.]